MTQDDAASSPAEMPQPVDDGGADHLVGMTMPGIALPSIGGGQLRVDTVPAGYERLVLYAYPLTGRPDVDNPEGWDEIPGARGCTPESCGFRDHAADLAHLVAAVVGVSTQSSKYQRETAQRLSLPYPLLSDHELQLTHALSLPTLKSRSVTRMTAAAARHWSNASRSSYARGSSSTSSTRCSHPNDTRPRYSHGSTTGTTALCTHSDPAARRSRRRLAVGRWRFRRFFAGHAGVVCTAMSSRVRLRAWSWVRWRRSWQRCF